MIRLLKATLGAQIVPKSVTLSYHGTCLNDASLSPFDPGLVGKDAAKPIIRNPIDRINVTAGELLRFKVPEVPNIYKLILCYFDIKMVYFFQKRTPVGTRKMELLQN